jgi:hypothetical protein
MFALTTTSLVASFFPTEKEILEKKKKLYGIHKGHLPQVTAF